MSKPEKSVKVLVTLDGDTARKVKEMAVKDDRSVSYMVARFVRDGLDRLKK